MKKSDAVIVRQFMAEHSTEAAAALEKFEPRELADFFNATPVGLLVAIIPQMNPQLILSILDLMKQDVVIQLFESLDVGNAELLIRMMNDSRAELILNNLSAKTSMHIRRLLKYLKNSVGSFVEQTVFTLNHQMTIKEALALIRRYKTHIDPNLFVLSQDRTLMGMTSLLDLIRGNPEKQISSIMNSNLITIAPDTSLEFILDHPAWREQFVLPVVDESMVFLGTINLETIRTRQLDSKQKIKDQNLETINALGDLYQIGLAGLLRVASDFKTSSE